MMNAISLAMFLTLSIYLTTGFLALNVFGPNISNNILFNFNKIDGFLPMLLQLIFLIVIICHVPYMFLVGKEAVCIVGDEILNKTMSSIVAVFVFTNNYIPSIIIAIILIPTFENN